MVDSLYDLIERKGYPSRGQAPRDLRYAVKPIANNNEIIVCKNFFTFIVPTFCQKDCVNS